MLNTRIEALRAEYIELIEFMRETKQISFELYIANNYKKSLLLSAASYFEDVIIKIIIAHANFLTGNDEKIATFIESKVLKRQYHTLFTWDAQNSNTFWMLFGESTKEKARTLLHAQNLIDAEKAFLAIGNQRNNLVHRNYIEAKIDSTFDEIYNQYTSASKFVKFIQEILPNQ